MFSKVNSTTIQGLSAHIVTVETDVGNGLPIFEMSGYLASEVKEARERVRVAIKNAGIELRPQRIVVNISPADIRKDGTGFDLPIAIGILAANGVVSLDKLEGSVIIGELSLDGTVNSVNGILPSVCAAKEQGYTRCIMPMADIHEGSIISEIEVLGTASLRELVDYLNDDTQLACGYSAVTRDMKTDALDGDIIIDRASVIARDNIMDEDGVSGEDYALDKEDFLDIKGQHAAKRATLIAVAGMHNIMYVGSPGSGKTMLARRIPTIMPELTFDESLELTKIYSVAGQLNKKSPIITSRPFRSPHHNVTQAALIGGGRIPRAGEITLAGKGVLFLDEITEYKPETLEALRQPLEDKSVTIVRLNSSYTYPADFMLAAAMNPCKCGYYPDRNRCNCSEHEIQRYLGKISRPMWDRFDLCVQVGSVSFSEINGQEECKTKASKRCSKDEIF